MKACIKLLALLMAVLMLGASFVSCEQAADTTVGAGSDPVISGSDLQNLVDEEEEEEEANVRRTYAVDDAYIQGGDSADKNNSSNRDKTAQLNIKKGSANTERDILLKFKLDEINLLSAQSVYICISFVANKSSVHSSNGDPISFCAYKVSSNWNGKKVTYNTAPTYTAADLAGKGVAAALNSSPENSQYTTQSCVWIDVSDAVFDAYDSGEREISFRVKVDQNTSSPIPCHAGNAENEYIRPKLVARGVTSDATYETKLVEDAAENQAIWDHAQAVYDAWYARYQEILKNGDYDTEIVTTNKADYTLAVKARVGNGGDEISTFATRLVSTLKGYEEKVYDTDAYGGVLDGKKQEATGYYYTKKIGDRWWVVDPAGNLCHVHGTTHMKYAYTATSTAEIESALRVFGSFEKWAIAATRWAVDDLGFNMAYVVSDEIERVENNIPIMVSTNGIKNYGYQSGTALPSKGSTPVFLGDAMPVFDPAFETYMDVEAAKTVAVYGDKTYVFGYFSDNENNIFDTMLQAYLNLDPSEPVCAYTYACAWTWYCNVTGKDAPRVEDIDKYCKELGIDLWDLFKGFVYDRYYSVCQPAIKKYDPNRLYMGNRLYIGTNKWEWVMRFTDYWCDVMTVNYYHEWEIPSTGDGEGRPSLEQLGKWMDIPFIVTEFYAKGNDALNALGEPMDNNGGAGWVVATQKERGYFYQNFTLKLLQCKQSIGWMQFQFIENDPTDTKASAAAAQNSNKGIVDWKHDYEVYGDCIEQIALVNKNAYALIEFFDGVNYFE